MMTGQLRLSELQLSHFQSILALSESQLREILGRLDERTPIPMSEREVRRVVAEVLHDSPEQIEAITRQALALAGLQYRYNVPTDELAVALRSSLNEKLPPDRVQAWERLAPTFQAILTSRAIRTTVKSLELLYDYANLVQSSNVITDLRPIFDDDASHAIGAIVSFTLRLTYQNGDATRSLSFAMDAEDVERLHDQCGRALKKAESVRAEFSVNDSPAARIQISGRLGS